MLLVPIVTIVFHALSPATPEEQQAWSFIWEHTFNELVINTLGLCLITAFLSVLIGLLQATLICLTDFRAKKWLHVLFILPLAFPLYVLSFVYVGGFEFSGFLPTWLRVNWGLDITQWIDIKSIWGVSFVFSLGLSPYCYLFLHSRLQALDPQLIFAARSLGATSKKVFFQVLGPQVAPWMLASAVLICLEVVSDFGGVSVFNFDTFSTAVYQAWVGLFSFQTALKLSIFPLLFALLLFLFLSNWKVHPNSANRKDHILFFPSDRQRWGISFFVGGYLVLAVIYPLSQLLIWTTGAFSVNLLNDLSQKVFSTLLFSFSGAAIIILLATVLAFLVRFSTSIVPRWLLPFFKLGYALPGSILAIAVMSVFSQFQVNFFGPLSFLALIYAFTIKFLPVPIELLEKSYKQIPRRLDWSCFSLGSSQRRCFRKIHLPLLAPSILSALVLVALEILKEMPLTLVLRPFGFDTLGTKIYELTSEGDWQQASFFGLVLVCTGILTVFVIGSPQRSKELIS